MKNKMRRRDSSGRTALDLQEMFRVGTSCIELVMYNHADSFSIFPDQLSVMYIYGK
jgi:hypothetical protein